MPATMSHDIREFCHNYSTLRFSCDRCVRNLISIISLPTAAIVGCSTVFYCALRGTVGGMVATLYCTPINLRQATTHVSRAACHKISCHSRSLTQFSFTWQPSFSAPQATHLPFTAEYPPLPKSANFLWSRWNQALEIPR